MSRPCRQLTVAECRGLAPGFIACSLDLCVWLKFFIRQVFFKGMREGKGGTGLLTTTDDTLFLENSCFLGSRASPFW